MTLLSDDVSVFGNMLPTVYIKKVTLENGSVFPSNVNDRIHPHIKNKTPFAYFEEGLFEQAGTAAGVESLADEDGLIINIDFLLKENLGNTFSELTTTWSDKSSLQKYTNINTGLIDNPFIAKIYQNITRTEDLVDIEAIASLIDYFSIYNIFSERDRQICRDLGLRFRRDGTVTLQDGMTSEIFLNNFQQVFVDSIVSFQTINLASAMESGEGLNYGGSKALAQYSEVDEDGKKIVNYQFSQKFDYPKNKKPDFLCAYALATLSVEDLADDFDLDIQYLTGNNKVPKSKFKMQNIIVDGQVSSKSCVYYLEEDMSIWTGHFHAVDIGNNQVGYMTGMTTTPESRKLIKKNVDNTTIQDFRPVEKISKLKFDMSFIQTGNISLSEAYKFTRDKTDVLKQPAYFSKNWVSRGYDGSAKFLFGMNFYSFVREQTMFGAVLPPEVSYGNMKKARKAAKVLNIRIKRRRVDVVPQSNRLGTYNAQEIPFKTGLLGEPRIDKEEIVQEVIAAKEDQSHAGAVQSFKLVTDTTPQNNNSMAAVHFHAPDNGGDLSNLGFIFFTARDGQIARFTDGHYQYGVEMEILDKTPTYMIERVLELLTMYKQMKEYYTIATVPGKTYNVQSGRFRALLNNYYIALGTKPWLQPIIKLAEAIQEFRDQSEVFDAEEFQKNLQYMCAPDTGSPRGVNTALQLILNAATKLAEIVGTSINTSALSINTSSDKPIDTSVLTKMPQKRKIKIDYFFDNAYDTEVPKRYGYDYLTPTGKSNASFLQTGAGLLSLEGEAFNSRLKLETQKYFQNINPEDFEMVDQTSGLIYTPDDTIFTSLFSYITPAAINLGVGQFSPPIGQGASAADAAVGLTRYSLLPTTNVMGASKYLYNKTAFSYIAAKITNFNNNAVLPPYDTTISDNSVLSKYQDRMKFYTHQILSNKNCLIAMDEKFETDKDQTNNFQGLFMSTFLPGIDAVDSLDNNLNKVDALQQDTLNISYKGGSEVSLFLSFVYGFSSQCSGIASTKSPAKIMNAGERAFDLKFFQLEESPEAPEAQSMNIVQAAKMKMADTDTFISPGSSTSTVFVSPVISNQFRFLPNQIKSLLLESKSNVKVKHKWKERPGDPSQDPYYKATLAFNYRNIKRVEYLAGFQDGKGANPTDSSKPNIGGPVWKTLDAQSYANAIGKKLFCRLRTYENKEFGITPMECLEMPIFDEYFLLDPSDFEGEFTLPTAPTTAGLMEAVTTTVGESFSVPSEYHDDSFQAPPLDKQQRRDSLDTFLEGGKLPAGPQIGLSKDINLTKI